MELRNLPRVDVLAQSPELQKFPPKIRVEAARSAIDRIRAELRDGRPAGNPIEVAVALAQARAEPLLREAINLSGVILHTGLGRARLAEGVVRHLEQVAGAYSNLELDLDTGDRGDRQAHVRDLLTELTGAEDAFVVNNAAAGVVLTLSTLATGREVILSRGQMVEIGGSFRMPDIVRQSGCRLVEVGCTNKTRLSDYAEAITGDTAAILRCHPSNYRIVGFTEEPSLRELGSLSAEAGVRLIDDQGSGLLVDARTLCLPAHPTLPESAAVADVAVASGDKLIGGPQSGIVVGRREAILEIRKHPLARAFRIDKLSLAALEATLRLWTSGQEDEIPTIRDLRRPLEEIRRLADALVDAWPGAIVEEGITEAGSGAAPGTGVPTVRLGLPGSAETLARKLRTGRPPIVPRIERGIVWLDLRTLETDRLSVVRERLKELS